MREIELKILLDPDSERRLQKAPALAALGEGPARAQTLHSIYYDTADQALRAEGIALRLRKKGRRWVQTVKKATTPITGGLAQPIEDEIPVQGQNLALSRIRPDDLREEVIGIARAGLVPVAETYLRRNARKLRAANGALVELAIDNGEVRAQGRTAALCEAELELIDGHPGDLYAIAEQLFTIGPVRFSNRSKSARALMLAETGRAIEPLWRQKSAPIALDPKMTSEGAAIRVLSECLGQVLANLPVTCLTDDVGGPHQLRVGLRRLRTAFTAFRPALGRDALAPAAETARQIAAEVGRLRDLDVLAGEMVGPAVKNYPSEPGFAILLAAIQQRREVVRDDVRAFLITPEATAFGFRTAGFLAGRGWLDPADLNQTARLARPVVKLARKALDRRWAALSSYGNRIGALSIDQRHEMRKEIKKVRYVTEIFRSLFDPEKAAAFRAALRELQDDFGALNDVAMAELLLLAPDAPGADNPAAQRAAGRLIGMAESEADRLWPQTVRDWQALAETGPFWR